MAKNSSGTNNKELQSLEDITKPLENIQTHKFKKAKESVRSLSNNIRQEVTLDMQVKETEAFLLWNLDRCPTGKEVNELVNELREKWLTRSNNTTRLVLEGIEHIFNDLDILDNDYISGIKSSIKAIQTVNSRVLEQQETLEKQQKDISKAVDNEKRTLIDLKKIKDTHDKKINSMEKDVAKIKNDLKNLNHILGKVNDDLEIIKKGDGTLGSLNNKISSMSHFTDIDRMWAEVENLKKFADNHEAGANLYKERLDTLEQIIIPVNAENINEKVGVPDENMEDLKDNIGKSGEIIESLQGKIKTAYILAGIALVIAIFAIGLNLRLLGVL